jgi:uncharacterized protein
MIIDTPFVPKRWLENGHCMTLYAWARRRRFPHLPSPEDRVFDIDADTRVVARCHWQPRRQDVPTLVLLHGLEGSANSHYMFGMADKAFAKGLNVVRLNQRNCGGTDHLSVGVYNSGLTSDPRTVIRELIDRDGLRCFAVAGYSLGGNLTLKLAGELGAGTLPEVRAFAAVSPTLDLAACIEALERPSNWIYQQNFVRELKKRMRRKAVLFPAVYSTAPLPSVRTVRQFDDAYTAPMSGYRDAADYYHRASSLRVVDGIGRPTLILTAEDDPFIPVEPFHAPEVGRNPNITLAITRHGGHCGYIGSANGDDGYWAERVVVEWAARHTK